MDFTDIFKKHQTQGLSAGIRIGLFIGKDVDKYIFRQKVSRLFLPLNRLYWRLKWGPKTRKLIIGCGTFKAKDWICTDASQMLGGIVLDVSREADWARYFSSGTLTHILAEHVLEHFSDFEIEKILKLCRKYLACGGRLRLAVPDGHRKDPEYVKTVAPPADGHKQYFTADTLQAVLESVGFNVHRLEYYDEHGVFHKKNWNVRDGFIHRSFDNDSQKAFRFGDHHYTSLIIDAFKPV